ncbi:MAG: zinc-dependent peptidase [Verrucomicrobiales bacterium]|nr:zinc-dependent peptidase [Verrucomicrobiales bacterium]
MTLALLGILLLFAVFQIVRLTRRAVRRKRLLATPLPLEWIEALEKRFEIFRELPEPLREKLGGLMHVFLDEKRFEACGGLKEITDEMRVLVAAQACLLLLGLDKHGFFRRLKSILIYPEAYRDRGVRRFDVSEIFDHGNEEGDVRFGESWDTGSVVLSWQSIKNGALHADDGMNVIYHEFAHQLDQVDGSADGAPRLPNHAGYAEWARIFQREYEALVEAVDDPSADPLLDPYGATDPAEFFAVATETFFEMPEDLKKEHPELYDQLAGFYGLDPADWSARNK